MFRTSEDCKMYLPGHPDHDIRRSPVSKKEPFSNLRASVWSKNRGAGGWGPGPSPGSAPEECFKKTQWECMNL